MTEVDKAIHEALNRARAEGWNAGFYAGCTYGRACEQYDPSRDPEDCEPTTPTNPYLPRTPHG